MSVASGKNRKNLDKVCFVCPPLVPPPLFYSDVCGDSYSVCIYIYGYSSLFFSLPTSFLTGSGSLSVVLSAGPLTCTICTGSPSARYRYTSNPMPVQCKPCQCPYLTLICILIIYLLPLFLFGISNFSFCFP